jgi:hypothetical protein
LFAWLDRKKSGGVQNLKAEYEAEAQGWRQGIAEKAKVELAQKETELHRQLEAKRDAQIKHVRLWHSGLLLYAPFNCARSFCFEALV